MKHKIVIDCRMIHYSGIGTYIKSVIPGLMDKINNCSFYLIVNYSVNYFLKNNNATLIKIEAKPYSIKEQFEIRNKIPKKISLYWSPHYINPLFLHANYLLTIHDLYHLNKTRNLFKRIYSYLYFSHIKFYQYNIIAVSNFTMNELVAFNFNPSNITVIHNGLPENFKDLKIKRKNFILTVGNMKKNKNILRLVMAFESIQDVIDLDLYIVGEYENIRDRDEEALNKIMINDRIKLLGVLEKNMLEKYYNEAFFYIQPSIYEGFGYPPLEAMSCGCPVLSSNKGSLAEICRNAALYFDAYDYNDIALKMKDFIYNKDLYEEYIVRSKKNIKNYKLTTTINKTAELIDSIIK